MSETKDRVRQVELSCGELRERLDALARGFGYMRDDLDHIHERLDNMEASNKRLAQYVGAEDAVTTMPEPAWWPELPASRVPWPDLPY